MGPGIPLSTIFLDESWNTLLFLIFQGPTLEEKTI